MINIFDSDAFSLTSLTAALNNAPFKPSLIGDSGLFSEEGISTLTATIESENGVLSLVEVKPRNGVPNPVAGAPRVIRPFLIPHLPTTSTIMADEVQGVRVFGSESDTDSIDAAVAKRAETMRRNIEYTIESHRLAAIMGNYIDANGAQISLATEFGVTAPTPISFALNSDTTKVRGKTLDVLTAIEDGLGGLAFSGVHAYAGKDFWQALIDHPALKDTVLNWQAAQSLRDDPRLVIDFGGIRFERYRGTSAVKVADKEAWAFPVGVPDLFITRYAPANYIETVNTIGLPMYAKSEPLPMGKGVKIEAQSNPLNINTRPAAVVKLTTP